MARLTKRELDLIQQSRLPMGAASIDQIDRLLSARGIVDSDVVEASAPARTSGIWPARLVQSLRQGMLRRRTIRSLNRLDDRLLRDIGLERDDIERYADRLNASDRQAPARPSRILASLKSWREQRAAIAELEALDDHLLRDIGVARTDIRLAVKRGLTNAGRTATLKPSDERSQGQSLLRRWAIGLVAPIREWHGRRRTMSELRHLDDRMLADIGIARGQIPEVAQRLTVRPEAGERPSLLGSALMTLRRWNLSHLSALQMARLGPDVLSDLGYVKGDIDWVPVVLAERKLGARPPARLFR